jgi:hypothetical protein
MVIYDTPSFETKLAWKGEILFTDPEEIIP